MNAAIHKPKLALDCTPEHAEMLFREINKVRCWLTGFREAGKNGPPGEDGLRQVEVLLKDAISMARKK